MADSPIPLGPESIPEPPKLPNMNEFSPGQVGELAPLLDLIKANQSSYTTLLDALVAKFTKTPLPQKIPRARNTLIGMSQCGLFNLTSQKLTDIGEALQEESDIKAKNSKFAVHLLTNHYGLEILDSVRMISDRGEVVTKLSILDELRSRGFEVTENCGDPGKIRQWLEPTGIIDENWHIDEDTLQAHIGATTAILSEWKGLSRSQRAFLAELKALSYGTPEEWVFVRIIKSSCERKFGRRVFKEGQLKAEIIRPLIDAGWFIEEPPKTIGRGGDSGRIKPSSKLTDISIGLPVSLSFGIPSDLRSLLATPLSTIQTQLKSANTYTKGVALELLALRLIRDLGLFPCAFRLRASKTSGAEVDLIADGLHLHYSRWLFQCKNTDKVSVEDLAKEVGMAFLMKAQVIVMVTTGRFTSTVRQYATGLAQSTALQAILIDGDVLNSYMVGGPNAVVDFLKSTAEGILRLKANQVAEMED